MENKGKRKTVTQESNTSHPEYATFYRTAGRASSTSYEKRSGGVFQIKSDLRDIKTKGNVWTLLKSLVGQTSCTSEYRLVIRSY